MDLLGDLTVENAVCNTVKQEIRYNAMTPQQQAIVNIRLEKLGAISKENMFLCLLSGRPLVVDCRNPGTSNDRADCKFAIPGAIPMATDIGQCANVFQQKMLTGTGPFVTQNRPKAVVFYYSYGSQRSPEMAYRYLEWLEGQGFAQETQVAYLRNGIIAFSGFVDAEIKRRKEKENLHIDKSKYSKLLFPSF
ncbi:MAG: hypothetical protein Q9219_001044 [cf. Caloplaca sp. 3 TL-2023]